MMDKVDSESEHEEFEGEGRLHLRVGVAEANGELWSGRVYGGEEDGCPGGGGNALGGCGEGGFL